MDTINWGEFLCEFNLFILPKWYWKCGLVDLDRADGMINIVQSLQKSMMLHPARHGCQEGLSLGGKSSAPVFVVLDWQMRSHSGMDISDAA